MVAVAGSGWKGKVGDPGGVWKSEVGDHGVCKGVQAEVGRHGS